MHNLDEIVVVALLIFAVAVMTGLLLSAQQKRWPALRYIAGGMAVLLIAAILFPLFAQKRNGREPCLGNVKQISLALLVYSADYDERLPQKSNWWQEGVIQYLKAGPTLQCRYARNKPGYALNSAVAGIRTSTVESPSKTVMVFESEVPGPDPTGSVADLAFRHRGNGAYVAAIDSRARSLGKKQVGDFIWTPTFAKEVLKDPDSTTKPQEPAPSSRR